MYGTVIYLANPFTTDDAVEKEWRFLKACEAAGLLMQQGKIVFSPIVHGWPIARIKDLPTDWEYWQESCSAMVSRCQVMIILTLPGWNTSIGVFEEIKVAKAWNLEILYMNPDTFDITPEPN